MNTRKPGFYQGGLGQAVTYAGTPGCLRIVYSCRCAKHLGRIEEIRLLVERWAFENNLEPDDRAGLLLLLDDLLPDVCSKALQLALGGKDALEEKELVFELRLGLGRLIIPGLYRHTFIEDSPSSLPLSTLSSSAPSSSQSSHEPAAYHQCLTLILTSNLGEFNVSDARFSRELIEERAPMSLSGHSLFRLFAIRTAIERRDGRDCLVVEMPLSAAFPQTAVGNVNGEPAAPGSLGQTSRAGSGGIFQGLTRLWRGRLALRQTILFMLSSLVLLWFGIWAFYAAVEGSREQNALSLAIQSMSTLDSVSTTFLRRVESGVNTLASRLSAMRFSVKLFENSEAMLAVLRGENFLRHFTKEAAFIGIVSGKRGESGAWMYTFDSGQVQKSRLSGVLLADGPGWQSQEGKTSWAGPIYGLEGPGINRHSAIVCSLDMSMPYHSDKYWLGVILGMTWAEGALRGVSGFTQAEPLFLTARGEYVIYPPGRQAKNGPQTIFEDAVLVNNPALAEAAKRIKAGGKGLAGIGKGETLPWPLPWEGETSILYHPLSIEGWRLGLLVPNEALGRVDAGLSNWLLILGICGPLLVGLVTFVATSRILVPVRKLACSLENMEKGNLDTPFPPPVIEDETGGMLRAFEKTRIILKASLRNLLLNATTQQQLDNELGLARSIQQSMLPTEFPSLDGADITAWLDISREVCGDLYNCFIPDPANPHIVALVVGDVCGKGVPAALVMSRGMSLAGAVLARGLSPAQALEQINMAILRKDASNMFVTMLIGLFNAKDGTFTYASAGHPPPITGPAPGEENCSSTILPWSNELVLGVMANIKYSVFSLTLEPGQAMLLRTDGADEAMGPATPAANGEHDPGAAPEIFGEERLAKSFARACRKEGLFTPEPQTPPSNPATQIVNFIRQDLLTHMDGLPAHDDTTLLVVKRHSLG